MEQELNLVTEWLLSASSQMTNLLIVEVKPANAEPARMADDLKKLTHFRRELRDQHGNPANYHAAYLWIYGLRAAEWPDLRAELLESLQGDAQFDRDLVSCIIHETAQARATPAPWG